jgi:hypothetical protein
MRVSLKAKSRASRASNDRSGLWGKASTGVLNHEPFGFIIASAIGDRAQTITGTRQ